jgi:intracellular sulfur oxidation DsrE/DsrF family protein
VLHEQDRWLDALTGMHRQVYDIVTPAGTIGIAFARNFLTANAEGYGLTDTDSSVVVSFRHRAVYYAFGDAMWEKFKFGESVQPEGGAQNKNPATRNSELSLITTLQSRGVVFTVCGMALRRRAREAAQRAGTPPEAMLEQWRAGLIPGVVEVAAGVIAVNRAQERGFTYVYAG